jgi:choline dehydrogenase
LTSPDLQIIFSAVGYGKESDGRYFIESIPSVMAHVMLSYPESRGRIALKSNNPKDPPLIECPLLASRNDVAKLIAGLRGIRQIMHAAPMGELVLREVLPGAYAQSDTSLEEYVRKHAGISFHPIGTCRMGLGPEAVVAPDLRVRGFENLWVGDASVIPKHPSANTNAVCIMIGKKLGKQLAARHRSPSAGYGS